MIVEDEVTLAEVLRDFVRDLGHEAIVVSDAERAAVMLPRETIDAILLDVNLPGMSGLDFLKLPGVRDSGVPVIVMSGVATEAQARESLALGALDFLAKPIALERLSTVFDFVAPGPAPVMAGSPDRRPARRIRISLPVRMSHNQKTWNAVCTELSASGMKARSNEVMGRGLTVRLSFNLPDAGRPIDVLSLVVRIDRDGAALWFLDLEHMDAARIDDVVKRRPA
ncbi:MAG TPA: response regulator [Longimicrobiales bacterium]|nr:response regulator [Longimicrobiales bacterium]